MSFKLVREKIGREVNARPANSSAGRHLALFNKLHEEVEKLAADPTNFEEYADILEVLFQIAEDYGIEPETIERVKKEKFEKKGGFKACLVAAGHTLVTPQS